VHVTLVLPHCSLLLTLYVNDDLNYLKTFINNPQPAGSFILKEK
jgi:hypothetical protein